MIKLVSLLWRFWVSSFQIELQYRVSFILNVLNSLLSLGCGLLVLLAIFGRSDSLVGWTLSEAVVVLGTFTIAEAFIGMVLRPSLGMVPELIELGTMDHLLTKPVNILFVVSMRSWNIWRAPAFLLGFGISFYAMHVGGHLTLSNALLFTATMIAGLIVLYSISAIIAVTSFWFVRINNAFMLLFSIVEAGRFPASIYPDWLRLFFTLVVPVVFVTNVPAAVAMQKIGWPLGSLSIVVAAIALLIAAYAWRCASRSYTSASS